jgi:hypothetical protein
MPKETSTKRTKRSFTTKTTTKKTTPTEKPITKKDTPNSTAQKARLIKKIDQQAQDSQIEKQIKKTEKKIPIGIRIFFGCSLLLFCIALYKAILLPKIIQRTPNDPIVNITDNELPILTDDTISFDNTMPDEPIIESQT